MPDQNLANRAAEDGSVPDLGDFGNNSSSASHDSMPQMIGGSGRRSRNNSDSSSERDAPVPHLVGGPQPGSSSSSDSSVD